MSFKEDEMYPVAHRALRKRYPASSGWEIYSQNDWGDYRPDFVIEKRNFWGVIKRAVAEVKAECRITQSHVDQLNQYARNLAGNNVKIIAKHLIVPSGADTSVVPDDIDVIYLRGFRCK